MQFRYTGKRISGVLTLVPEHESRFEDELDNYDFPARKSLKLRDLMGFDRRRTVVDDQVCASDLCVEGLRHLFASGKLAPESIGALIFVSQTPDYLIPPTSNLIQGRLELGHDVFCMDINQGCAGYLVGLMQAFSMLEQPCIEKVVLLNADTLSRKACARDRNIHPMIGDAASITVVERDPAATPIAATLKMDGTRAKALMIPAGGMRMPCTPETASVVDTGDNNYRALEHFFMQGTDVFNFVQTEVPPMIEEVRQLAGVSDEDVESYLFHQPNRFMLHKLADKMGVSRERLPANIVEHFGNASSVTIPTNIAFNLGEQLTRRSAKVCLAGFGVGLTWSSMILDLGPLDFCELRDF